MVLPIGTARGTTVRRTTTLTLLGALAILLALPTFAFASPVSAPAVVAAPLHMGPGAHDGSALLHRAIGALSHGEGPAFGTHLQCSASTATTAHCGGSPAALRPVHPSAYVQGWQNATPGVGSFGAIGNVYGASMAWDPASVSIVYFGGCDTTSCPDNQTWVFDLFGWFNDTNYADAPPAVAYASMDFDYQANAVMLFGGCGAIQCPMNETWTWSAGTWTNQSGPFCFYICYWAPTPRFGSAMAFANNTGDNETVLFGGCLDPFCYGVDNLTYEWYGQVGAWLPIATSTAPVPSAFASMAYDPDWGSLILFGGCQYFGCLSNETWQFFNGAWSNLTGENTFFGFGTPPARGEAQMTYDAATHELLLFGGFGNGFLNDTWAFSCPYFCGWSNVTPAVNLPGDIELAAIPSESTLYAPLFHGGVCSCVGGAFDSTWVFELVLSITPSVGPNPAPALTTVSFTSGVSGGQAPYGSIWLTGDGGYFFGDATHSYAAAGSYPVALSLYDFYGVYVNYSTTEVITTVSAQASVAHTMTDVLVADVFTGSSATGGTAPYDYNWSFGDGTWLDGTQSPSHAFAAIGTYQANLTVTDANLLVDTTSVTVQVVAAPTVTVALSAATIDAGGSITFTPTAAGGVGTYSYAWTLGDASTSAATAPVHLYATAGTYHANVTVTDGVGGTGTASVSVTVNPAVSGAATAAPVSIDAGASVNFSATGSGGSGTYTYAWSFGDGNHSTFSAPNHVYAKAGNYTARVWINDTLGGSYSKSFSVSVKAVGGGSGGSSTSNALPSWALWAVLGLVIVVVAVAAILMMMRRRKSTPPPSSPPSGAAGGAPPSAPPPGAQ